MKTPQRTGGRPPDTTGGKVTSSPGRTGGAAATKRKEAESQKLRTEDGYKEYRQATDYAMGAPVPAGLSDAKMTLTGASDLKTAFDMLDEKKEGVLDRIQARKWLRCAGWCVTDEVLDQMLDLADSNVRSKMRGMSEKRSKWGLKHLQEVADTCRDRENSSLEDVQRALKRLAGGNKTRITRDRLLEFTVQEKGLKKEDLDEVLDILGMDSNKLFDCDELAQKLLYRICNPPSVFEQQTY
eukprot:CAMPEP_0169293018 /NCGR_PEP_ID=MMETSP1016-20121227/63056_1 /TAXON_ID=342587 /ORGANISM="Karlodinium micrum, Strain CCMP2283" /LENGTH=239 /DNA_ID=CAMNT_0009383661 /DNA_START=57 /DNA_END=776 /DNA_ORIENTATION=+